MPTLATKPLQRRRGRMPTLATKPPQRRRGRTSAGNKAAAEAEGQNAPPRTAARKGHAYEHPADKDGAFQAEEEAENVPRGT